jgi:hypothetical protein
MDAANSLPRAQLLSTTLAVTRRVRLRHVLAGLEAGILGSLALCGWLMLSALFLRRPVWSAPNLFGTLFYGPHAYTGQFQRSSVAGLALILLLYGLLGAVWGVIWQEKSHPFLRLLGAGAGLAVYALFFNVVWPHTNPLIALYAPSRQMQVAHLLWGVVLAASPRFARNIALLSGESIAEPETVVKYSA